MNIALAQTEISTIPHENLDTAGRMIARASASGADLVVFPEMFMARPQKESRLAAIAEPLNGPFVTGMRALASHYGVAVISGIWERSEPTPNKAVNCALAIDKNGTDLAMYRKIHLFDALNVRESDNMIGGTVPPPLFTVGDLAVGLAICYDLRFPELFRYLARNGADVIVVPAAWYGGPMKEEHWLGLLQARAIENTCYVAGVCPSGLPFIGRSTVFDPFGVRIAGSGEEEALVVALMEAARIEEVRAKLPCLRHAKHHLFAD